VEHDASSGYRGTHSNRRAPLGNKRPCRRRKATATAAAAAAVVVEGGYVDIVPCWDKSLARGGFVMGRSSRERA